MGEAVNRCAYCEKPVDVGEVVNCDNCGVCMGQNLVPMLESKHCLECGKWFAEAFGLPDVCESCEEYLKEEQAEKNWELYLGTRNDS